MLTTARFREGSDHRFFKTCCKSSWGMAPHTPQVGGATLPFLDVGTDVGTERRWGGRTSRVTTPRGLEAAGSQPTVTLQYSEESSLTGERNARLKKRQNRAYFKPQQFQQLPKRCAETAHRTAFSKNNMNPMVYHSVCC